MRYPVNTFSSRIAPAALLTLESFEETLRVLRQPYTPPRPRLIVSPEVRHLIETDPVIAEAARIALAGG